MLKLKKYNFLFEKTIVKSNMGAEKSDEIFPKDSSIKNIINKKVSKKFMLIMILKVIYI